MTKAGRGKSHNPAFLFDLAAKRTFFAARLMPKIQLWTFMACSTAQGLDIWSGRVDRSVQRSVKRTQKPEFRVSLR